MLFDAGTDSEKFVAAIADKLLLSERNPFPTRNLDFKSEEQGKVDCNAKSINIPSILDHDGFSALGCISNRNHQAVHLYRKIQILT